MSVTLEPEVEASLYERDFALWAARQAALLRAGRLGELDLANLVEEVEDMGRSIGREMDSRLVVLLTHLLKYAYQADKRSSGWRGTIAEQRTQLELLAEEAPSQRRRPAEKLAAIYLKSRRQAAAETELAVARFPETCPWSAEDILDPDFWPEA